jgi:hypothetical protein
MKAHEVRLLCRCPVCGKLGDEQAMVKVGPMKTPGHDRCEQRGKLLPTRPLSAHGSPAPGTPGGRSLFGTRVERDETEEPDPEHWRDVRNVTHVLGKYIISDTR